MLGRLVISLLVACSLFWSSPAWPAAIAHTFVEQNTKQVIASATYVDITGAAITSGNFTTGKKYLIYVTAQTNEDSTGRLGIQLVHGSTAFAESETLFADSAARYIVAPFLTVWTAVGGEGIKLQAKVSGGNVDIDNISIFTMNLSDDLVEGTDWAYAERTTDDALSTTPTNGAAVTITPSGASDWLVLSTSQIDYTDTGTRAISKIVRSGEASSTAPVGDTRYAAAADQPIIALSRVFALTAASNTFTERSEASATAGTRLHSAVFVLNLNKFAARASGYTAADLATPNTYTQLQTASITPTVTGDVWMGGSFGWHTQSGTTLYLYRLQVDNSDQPPGQTDNLVFVCGTDPATNITPAIISTLSSLSNAAHTIDLDARATGSGPQTTQDRSVWAMTMELASSGRRAVPPLFLGE